MALTHKYRQSTSISNFTFWQSLAFLDATTHLYKRSCPSVRPVLRGQSKKSVSWSRPHRKVRFFATCLACLKNHILSIFRRCKILTIFTAFYGKFWREIFQVFKNGSKFVLPDRTGIWHVKIKLSFNIYACWLNKTTKTINKCTNELPGPHFFLTDPLSLLSLS